MRFAFFICRELRIDDPTAWYDRVGDILLDQWIAFFVHEARAAKAGGKETDPQTQLMQLWQKTVSGA